MISVFLREQKRYTQEDLVKEFHCSEEKTVRILKRLKEYGVLKAVKANDTQKDLTDLLDEDIEIADVEVGENEYLYVFTFVGVRMKLRHKHSKGDSKSCLKRLYS